MLDLYAGSGALGIEALSRGAAQAVFVERSAPALRAIRENLERTRLGDRAVVVGMDVRAFLARSDRSGAPFDLVFADPPYDLPGSELERVFAGLAQGWLRREGWTVVLTRRKGSSMPVVPLHWAPARRLEYGDTLVVLLREA